jgi:hypothetical protein
MPRLTCALITIFYYIVVHHSTVQFCLGLSSFSSFSYSTGLLTNLRQSDLRIYWGHKVMQYRNSRIFNLFRSHTECFAKSTRVDISRHRRIMQAFSRLGTLQPSFQLCTTKRLRIVSSQPEELNLIQKHPVIVTAIATLRHCNVEYLGIISSILFKSRSTISF